MFKISFLSIIASGDLKDCILHTILPFLHAVEFYCIWDSVWTLARKYTVII